MPKRSKTKSSAKRKIGKKPDRLAEVYIKEEKDVLQSSSTDSSSSSSSDSSDSDYLRKVKKLKRKDLNGKKYYKKIRKQIDTFQQNVDIKLNYMDMVLKNILKAQNAHVPVVVPSSYNVNNESASVRIPEKQLDSKTMKNEIKLELDSVEELEYFEERLKSDEDYREKVVSISVFLNTLCFS